MMKRGSKWEANVHHHAYRAEIAFLEGNYALRQKHLKRLYALVPGTHVDVKRMEEIVHRATLQAHKDFRESK